MNAEVKNNEVAVNMNQNNMNEVPAQTTTNNEVKENTMKEEQNSTTTSTTTSTNTTASSSVEQPTSTAATTTAPEKAKRSNHKKTDAERLAEKLLAKENRMKALAAMSDDQKKDELHRIEQHIKRINTGSRQVGLLYKQIRDEKLYEQSEYSSSFTLYCRVTFKESRSNVYRQINYVEILEIIGEFSKDYAEKTIRPLSCFKITSKNNEQKDKEKDKDAPEKYDTTAIQAVWNSVKKAGKKKSITEKLVREHLTAYRKTLLGGNDPDKVYVPSMNKCFNRSSFVDELIKEKKTAAGLLSVTKEMKDILTADELTKIKTESDSLTDKEFQGYTKSAHAETGYDMSSQQQSA